jgi:hypothetical protein
MKRLLLLFIILLLSYLSSSAQNNETSQDSIKAKKHIPKRLSGKTKKSVFKHNKRSESIDSTKIDSSKTKDDDHALNQIQPDTNKISKRLNKQLLKQNNKSASINTNKNQTDSVKTRKHFISFAVKENKNIAKLDTIKAKISSAIVTKPNIAEDKKLVGQPATAYKIDSIKTANRIGKFVEVQNQKLAKHNTSKTKADSSLTNNPDKSKKLTKQEIATEKTDSLKTAKRISTFIEKEKQKLAAQYNNKPSSDSAKTAKHLNKSDAKEKKYMAKHDKTKIDTAGFKLDLHFTKPYFIFEETLNFQYGMLQDSTGHKEHSLVRFAPVGNYTLQFHEDLGHHIGFYTGIGTKNLGFIIRNDTARETVKSRAYCLSVPVGLKFGNMKKEKYLFIQGEILWQFDYKEKIFSTGEKTKRKNFYDPGVNPMNYSASVGYNHKGFTFGVEYTLSNFFASGYHYQDPVNSVVYPSISKSQIVTFYIGFRADLRQEKQSPPKK